MLIKLLENNEYLESMFTIEQCVHIEPWSKKILNDSFSERYINFGIFDENELIGYAIFDYVLDEATLQNIAIAKNKQSKGLGKELLQYALNYLNQEKHIKTVFLEVRISNIPAISLYKKLGFNQDYVRKNYYKTLDGNFEHALCFSKNFA